MEYIAFLFLGLGVLLVLAGVLLQANERRSGMTNHWQDYALRNSPVSLATDSVTAAKPQPTAVPAPAVNTATVPGPFQFVQNSPAPAAAPAVAPVAVSVGQANPKLFEKFAYLYLDSSQRNVYDGTGSAKAFDLSEVQGIRRFGRGVFSYDGFSFYFDHTSGQERFPLANLKTIGFYPNCVALTFRTNQPVALLFMEETETIRKLLETFRAEATTA